uniref:Uncharacterized protein n=1 Tax=Triticum urartu TaxID=4572 RepID=A0A8R7JY87_TRIUA
MAACHPVPPPTPQRCSTSTRATATHPCTRRYHIQPPSPRAPYKTRGHGCLVPHAILHLSSSTCCCSPSTLSAASLTRMPLLLLLPRLAAASLL